MLDTEEAGTKVIRGGALQAAGYVTGVVLGLVSTPLMVRHLGVVDFGSFITVTSLIFIVSGLTDVGLTSIGVREYATREGSARQRFLRNLLGMRTVFTIAGIGAATVFSVAAGYESVLVAGTAIAGLGLLTTVLQHTFSIPLSTGLRLGWIAAFDLTRQAVTAALFVVLVLADASLIWFFWVSAISGAFVLAANLLLVRGRVPIRPVFDVSEWWSLLRQTLVYSAAAALGVVYFRVAVILMSLISTGVQTGYFSVAFRILEIVAGIPWLVVTAAFPVMARAARDDGERLRYSLQRIFEVSAIVSVWMAVVIYLGAPFAIQVVGGDEFDPAIDVLRVLALALIGTFLVAAWGYALLSLKRHSELLLANALAVVLGAALAAVLIPAEGAMGAAISLSATELALALIYLVLLLRHRPELRPEPRVLLPVLLATGLAMAIALAPLHGVAQAAIATIVYFGALFAMRAVPQEVTDAIPRRRRAA